MSMGDFLIGICAGIVGKIAEVAVAPVARQLGYLFYYERNKDNLDKKIKKLEDKKRYIDQKVKDAERRDEEAGEVDNWQAEVEKIRKDAEDFLKDKRHDKAKCSCSVYLWSRHQLSRESKKKVETIAGIIAKADTLQNSFHPRLIEYPLENRDFVAFDTRTPTFNEIMEHLEDPNYSVIGVHGMGGVGKTTLVREVGQKAREQGVFSDVVMVTVSQSVDLKGIQKEIVEMLNLELTEESLPARAARLRNQLKGERKVLLILDDIWTRLDLEAIGIYPRENGKGAKLLLVSRDRDLLCNEMNVGKDIEVGVLSKEEAMTLFKKYVSRTIEEHKFKDLSTKIVGRCGGLPIAIVTIACALKNKEIHFWRDALKKLEGAQKQAYGAAYSCIKTSYDFLESIEEKTILLLCSLHEEDANIDVKDLTSIYFAYRDMFKCMSKLEEARDSVRRDVDNLRGRSLLLNGDYDGTVKLHDVIRQIMLLIASEDNNMCCFDHFKSLKNDLNPEKREGMTAISLLGLDFDQLRDDWTCPRLKLFMRQSRKYGFVSQCILVPQEFLEEVKELRALCLTSVVVKPSSLSSCSFSNLTTLSLQHSVLEDIAFIGELEKLVVLDLSYSKFRELPEQIGKLTCLHQLNLNGCTDLKVVRPNVISSLKQMEELYMDRVCIQWGMEAKEGDGCNADLAELVELPHLIALNLCILDASALSNYKLSNNKNLERYKIVVGNSFIPLLGKSSRVLHLNLEKQSQLHECGFQRLIKEAEELYLGIIPGVKSIVNQLDTDGFPQLKQLWIEGNDEVQQIIDSMTGEIQTCCVFKNLERLQLRSLESLERICCGRFAPESFGQLRSISVRRCDNLKNVLPYTLARKLQEIEVVDCRVMKEIVYHESEDHDEIEFSRLRSLTLHDLPNLIQFFSSEMETTSFHASSSVAPSGPLFNEKVSFPSLEILRFRFMHFSELRLDGLPSTSFMKNLKGLSVDSCNNLKYLFPFAIVGSLMQLVHLRIAHCPMMEEIIKELPGCSGKVLLPKLRSLTLENLKSLKRFCGGDCNTECESLLKIVIQDCHSLNSEILAQTLFNEKAAFSDILSDMIFINLQELTIQGCNNRLYLLSFATAKSLKQLKKLEVLVCDVMEHVISKATGEHGRLKISFPKLESIHLQQLPKLKSFCEGADFIECPSLLELELYDCEKLRTFIPDSASTTPILTEDKQEVEVRESANQQLLFSEKVAIPRLQKLSVKRCDSLKHLLCYEMALQLESLAVESCSNMEEVVVVKEANDQGRSMNEISYPKLKYLELSPYWMLKRFSSADHVLHFPSLLMLKICGTKDFKPMGSEPLFSKKVVLSSLEELHVWDCGEDVNEIWPHHSSTLFFPKFKVLYLKNLSHLMRLFENPGNIQFMPETFQTLETLVVENCPGLKTLAMSSYFSFKNLTDVVISKCHGMTSLFESSTAESLEQLTRMSISDCDQLTQVIRKNYTSEDEIAESEEIIFRRLEILAFHHLPSLKNFLGGNNNMLEFPNLKKLIVSECPEMMTFSRGTINAPKLNRSIIAKLSHWPFPVASWIIETMVDVQDDVQSRFRSLEQDNNEVEEVILEGDLNRSIRKLWEENDPHIALRWLFSEIEDGQNSEKIRMIENTEANSSK